MKSIAISFVIFLLPVSVMAGDFGFFGFRIGEQKADSVKNMKDRDILFIGSAEHAFDISSQKTAFVAMRSPDRCEEEGRSELRTTTCAIGAGEVQKIVLYHLNDKLVRVVAQLRNGQADSVQKRLKEKFGSNLKDIPQEGIVQLERVLADPKPGLTDLLVNPFGYTKKCNNCTVSYFSPKKEGEYVFLLKDPQVTALTLYSEGLITKEAPIASAHHAEEKRNAASNREF